METSFPALGHVSVFVSDASPHVVCSHDDGAISVALVSIAAPIGISLIGTPSELVALADKLRAIATAHETDTHPVGEAAREVVTDAEIPSFIDWALDQSINVHKLDPDAYETLVRQYVRTFSGSGS